MKYLILPLLIALFSITAQAELFSNSMSEEQIAEAANNQDYPGGFDEDELSVQSEILEAKQHITAGTLQWRAEQALKRDTASSNNEE